MNKIVSIIVTLGLIVALGIIFSGGSKPNSNTNITESATNIEVRNGIQYITVNAGGGYSPRVSFAKAGIPTKLIMKTDGAYDCSSSLVINSLGYRKMLPQTGETEIDIGTPEVGVPLQGVCGMGMYSFKVNFQS
jgi:plastocyanin domain-containing protein